MNQQQIAELFRSQELLRREARRKIILNHADLSNEQLTPEDQAINEAALKRIAEAQRSYEADLKALQPRPGYWKRLWKALLNRE